MAHKTEKRSAEDQLLQARARGLQEATEAQAMKAYGKVLGMDTFFWMNPQVDALATVLRSFPFPVHWVGSHKQISFAFETYPELAELMEAVVVYDCPLLKVDREVLNKIPKIACVEGIKEALILLKAVRREKCVFLLTVNGLNESVTQNFEEFLEAHR